MCYAKNEKWKMSNEGRKRTTKSRKSQNARSKWNLQLLANICSGHLQTSGDKRKISIKNSSGKRENYTKSNYIPETKSKG